MNVTDETLHFPFPNLFKKYFVAETHVQACAETSQLRFLENST